MDFLATSKRDIPKRRSLHAFFEYSWHLPLAEEQSVLRNQNTGEISLFGSFSPSTLNTKKDAAIHLFVKRHPVMYDDAIDGHEWHGA